MKKLRVGIIGLGVGESHISGFQAHQACDVRVLCDWDTDKQRMAREKYPEMLVEPDAEKVLTSPEIDVVSIATYDDMHGSQVITALKNGKHVFVEKPLCYTVEQVRQIRRLILENKRLQLSSNLILRRCPRFLKLREMIQRGELGEIFNIESDYLYGRLHKITEGWRGRQDYYSVVHGGAVHVVDLIQWLTWQKIVEVAAMGNNIASRNTAFRFNDFVTVILRFESGTMGKVSANFGCLHPHFHALSVFGTKGTFINTPNHGELIFSREKKGPSVKMTEAYPGYRKGDLIKSFIDGITGEGKPEIAIEEVFTTMSVCLAIEQSIHENRVVKVANYYQAGRQQ